jgi:hypothetical protein
MEETMSTQTTAQAFADAFNAGDLEKVAGYLAEDFQFSGPTPQPLGVIPATGKSFSNPEERGEAVIEGDKVVSLRVEAAEGSGLEGILRQIGAQPPSG